MIAPLSVNWLIRRMSHVVERHLANISAALRPYGLTAPMWRVLNGLAECGPSSISDIAVHTAFERSYVSRLVGRMADLGLVESLGDTTDKRFRNVRLSREGKKKHAVAREIVIALNAASMKGLDARDVETMMGLMDKVAVNIGAHIPSDGLP
ncbi:MAG: MarR family transcriptional regulator [Hyphomicrobiales bacterium]|nr:MarR family transcriptional regulator [Hyphomicrobiales bacterium]